MKKSEEFKKKLIVAIKIFLRFIYKILKKGKDYLMPKSNSDKLYRFPLKPGFVIPYYILMFIVFPVILWAIWWLINKLIYFFSVQTLGQIELIHIFLFSFYVFLTATIGLLGYLFILLIFEFLSFIYIFSKFFNKKDMNELMASCIDEFLNGTVSNLVFSYAIEIILNWRHNKLRIHEDDISFFVNNVAWRAPRVIDYRSSAIRKTLNELSNTLKAKDNVKIKLKLFGAAKLIDKEFSKINEIKHNKITSLHERINNVLDVPKRVIKFLGICAAFGIVLLDLIIKIRGAG